MKKKSLKAKVLKHLAEDTKEFKEHISEDKALKKALKKKNPHSRG